MGDGTLEPKQARHRRDGVPLDGAPDLGLFAQARSATIEPVTASDWSSPPGPYVAPSPIPPQLPPPPTLSEFGYSAAPTGESQHAEPLEGAERPVGGENLGLR